MKLSKKNYFLLIILFTISIIFIFTLPQKQKEITFLNSENDFQNKLKHALSLAKLDTFNLTYRDYLNEIEFYTRIENKDIQIIVSTQKNPYSQISTLQQVIKKDKMKLPKIIDLSSDKQYATF